MKIPAYHIDAFAGAIFSGNPAMVCPLDCWLEDEALQLISRENNLPVTAFFVETGEHHELRWFTPTVELNLCGHGTVAAAAVLFEMIAPARESVAFKTKGGVFRVVKDGPRISLDFPIHEVVSCAPRPEDLVRALGGEPREVFKGPSNYLAVYEREAEILALAPNLELLREVDCVGAIVTAKGEDVDFVSRYFAPRLGVGEDAATGSAHCTLAPYWSKILGKQKLHALQLSQRGGEMWCEVLEDKVRISAKAVRYAEGFIYV
ncbi:MAG TPA: PhzF family phenazine biosynthesis protein [Thermoanaerobaculia bacterium]|nr:PhzF family phenazine biosynthesis protein [Thermoanaerobaculia bacterium]